ncbi:MAG: AMP-binding protein [Gaiellales bacterium]
MGFVPFPRSALDTSIPARFAEQGVMDTHRNVLHNVMRYTNALRISCRARLTLLQAPAFSGAVSSIYGALLNGSAVLPYDVGERGVGAIRAWLAETGTTIYHSVPSVFRRAFAESAEVGSLRIVRLEGDRATPRDLELFRARFNSSCVLSNGLGATECGLVARFEFGVRDESPGAVVPIGRPLDDIEVLIVDGDGRQVAAGDAGEMLVRSRYLSPGYWRRPDLTAAAFSSDPTEPGVRLYRTGDLGRQRADGCLEHPGAL